MNSIESAEESDNISMSQLENTELIQDVSVPSSNTSKPGLRKPMMKKPSAGVNVMPVNSLVTYHGITLNAAAQQGNLPVCVLLWGMASAKKLNLMIVDNYGNSPMHYAAMADTPEVMGFFNQQTRGMLNNECRLIDSRNMNGETPLLKAAAVGVISVLKSLLDEGSDPFARDNYGNTAFLIMIKFGHLWGLNFLYSYIVSKYGTSNATKLLSCTDAYHHNALDWSAIGGDVNIIEFLLRSGLDIHRFDEDNRTSLYWSVKSSKLTACRFLVLCGCNPYIEDSTGISPYTLALAQNNPRLAAVLRTSRNSYLKQLAWLDGVNHPEAWWTTLYLTMGGSVPEPERNGNAPGNLIHGGWEQNSHSSHNHSQIGSEAPAELSQHFSLAEEGTEAKPSESTGTGSSDNALVVSEEDIEEMRKEGVYSGMDDVQLRALKLLQKQALCQRTPQNMVGSNSMELHQEEEDVEAANGEIGAAVPVLYHWQHQNDSGFQCLSPHDPTPELDIYNPIATPSTPGDAYNKGIERLSHPKQNGLVKRSHAIHSLIYNRPIYVAAISISNFCALLVSIWCPFYIWCLIYLVLILTYRKLMNVFQLSNGNDLSKLNNSNPAINSPFEVSSTSSTSWCPDRSKLLLNILAFTQNLMNAPEKQFSIWIGYMAMFIFYLLLCFAYIFQVKHGDHGDPMILNTHLSGISGAVNDTALYVLTWIFTIAACYYWLSIIYFQSDPGIIDTRQEDLEEVMQHSSRIGGAPPNHIFCRTTLVKKPLRSKYCVQSGFVIARMDHYCAWLNKSIGYSNHIAFMKFLLAHLLSSLLFVILMARSIHHDMHAGENSNGVDRDEACYVTEHLLSPRYFFVAMLCVTQIAVFIGLLTLFVEQCYNITQNITTNERLNGSRYAWMKDDNGGTYNRFHQGAWHNTLEFFRIGNYALDYRLTFEMPGVIRNGTGNTGPNIPSK